ncbi:hypothetical protein CTO_1007 [Chlamydia trachomatis A2497]|uniref:Uncharacterized protein n=1 Tax=Chlamydia trachomatis serovar A (strain A2497) TaxID=580047 RepID=G4NPJ6_CHLT4|nr:hypothetical protein CTO_1007 [Chlamydia trachomatis A2497]
MSIRKTLVGVDVEALFERTESVYFLDKAFV